MEVYRPQTIIDLADDLNYKKLPTRDKDELADWFHIGANKGSLVEFLKGFEHTTAVMQTKEGLERVAYEMMEDMKTDGVAYVETRFAPIYHINKDLYLEDTVTAVLKGLERGKNDFGVGYGLILCGMRNMKNTLEIAELAVNFKKDGVVGFDLAGEEGGFPPKNISMHFSLFNVQILILQFTLAKHLEKNLSGRLSNGAVLTGSDMQPDCLKTLF